MGGQLACVWLGGGELRGRAGRGGGGRDGWAAGASSSGQRTHATPLAKLCYALATPEMHNGAPIALNLGEHAGGTQCAPSPLCVLKMHVHVPAYLPTVFLCKYVCACVRVCACLRTHAGAWMHECMHDFTPIVAGAHPTGQALG